MARLVVDLQDRRPIWALPDSTREAIRDALPAGWDVAFMTSPADGSGDGVARAPEAVLKAVSDAEVYMGYGIPVSILEAGPGLRWVHSGAAGVGSSLTPELIARDLVFTNSAGIHGPPMAEHALGMILYFARGFDLAAAAKAEGRWGAEDYWAADAPVTEVGGSTVGILGYGGIGREVAIRVLGVGGKVLAHSRSAKPSEPGVDHVTGLDGLDRLFRESDYVVVTAPDTPETRGIVSRERLAMMKRGSVLINLARGRLVDEVALLEALDAGLLRGAGLDVFSQEPLPAGHPIFRHPRVFMTPHVSATTRRFWDRETALIVENLERHSNGLPLRNTVDQERGY